MTIPCYFFTVTNWLVTLLAAGMASQLVGYLQQAGIITVLDETVWDTSAILSERSVVGRVLHTLIGYADQPTAIQVIAYVAVIAFIWSAARLLGDPTPARPSKAVLT